MARCIFENLTQEQAAELAIWFDGQGEQDCDIWFEANGVDSPWTDSIDESDPENVIVYCK